MEAARCRWRANRGHRSLHILRYNRIVLALPSIAEASHLHTHARWGRAALARLVEPPFCCSGNALGKLLQRLDVRWCRTRECLLKPDNLLADTTGRQG